MYYIHICYANDIDLQMKPPLALIGGCLDAASPSTGRIGLLVPLSTGRIGFIGYSHLQVNM